MLILCKCKVVKFVKNFIYIYIYTVIIYIWRNVLLIHIFIVKTYTCFQRESSYYTGDIVTWKQVDECIKTKETHEFVSEINSNFFYPFYLFSTFYVPLIVFLLFSSVIVVKEMCTAWRQSRWLFLPFTLS